MIYIYAFLKIIGWFWKGAAMKIESQTLMALLADRRPPLGLHSLFAMSAVSA